MHNLVTDLCAHFEATPPVSSQEACIQAMVIIERHTGLNPSPSISQEASIASLNAQEIERLLTALAAFIKISPTHPDTGSAIFALGKSRDVRFESLYRIVLSLPTYDTWAQHQARIALGNLGFASV